MKEKLKVEIDSNAVGLTNTVKQLRQKHQTEFKCRECNFVTGKKVLRRQHMRRAHDKKKKCESCNFEAENGSTLKTHRQSVHGIVSTSVGFMFTNERQINENLDVEKPEESEGPSKKRKTNPII